MVCRSCRSSAGPSSRGPALCGLLLILSLLASCGGSPTPAGAALVSSPAAVASPTVVLSPVPSNTPSPRPTVASATVTASPTVPTRTPSPAPSLTATLTPTHTPTLTPSPSRTPQVPVPTLLPTQTITVTVKPSVTPTPASSPTPVPTVAFGDDVVNILLIGLDSTSNLNGQNTDVLIVVSINKTTRQVSMLSIPRDLWVYIPSYGWNRINTAHRRGYSLGYPGLGPALLIDTLEINFGLPIHHWARVDFVGFTKVVDQLGGVDLTVACPVNLRYKPPASEEEQEMVLLPGIYHMDGETALRYVRTRRNGSDFDRSRRQHQFLKAMWSQFKDPDIVTRIPGLWTALSGSVKTDLRLDDLLSLARVGIEIKPQRVHSYYIGRTETIDWVTDEGWQVLLPRLDKIQLVLAKLVSPPSAAADQVAGEGATVEVLNGTATPHLPQFAADQLQWYGLKIARTGAADRTDYPKTQIIVFTDRPKTVETLARLLKVRSADILYQQGGGQGVDIRVVLGADYDPCK